MTNHHKVRRLHLIVVDLWRPWRYNARQAKTITDQLCYVEEGLNSRRMSPFRPCGPAPPPRCRRYAFGYALDNSEFPCYLVWPQRDGQSYCLLDTATNDTLQLSEQYSFRILGIHHFCDSFALVSQIGIREDALVLFDLQEEELLSDLHITRYAVFAKDGAIIRNISLINMLRQLTDTMFRLTLSVLLKGKLLRTLEMKKQASRLLTLGIAALIKTKKPHWMDLPYLPLLKTSSSMSS